LEAAETQFSFLRFKFGRGRGGSAAARNQIESTAYTPSSLVHWFIGSLAATTTSGPRVHFIEDDAFATMGQDELLRTASLSGV
jgi:hypothetical protein